MGYSGLIFVNAGGDIFMSSSANLNNVFCNASTVVTCVFSNANEAASSTTVTNTVEVNCVAGEESRIIKMITDAALAGGGTYVADNVTGKHLSSYITSCGTITRNDSSAAGAKFSVIEPAADYDLSASESGSIIVMNAGIDVNLPTPKVGLTYKFIVDTDVATTSATITATSNGTAAATLFSGMAVVADTAASIADKSLISFVKDKSTEGDYVEVHCVSNTITADSPSWNVTAVGVVTGSVTHTAP